MGENVQAGEGGSGSLPINYGNDSRFVRRGGRKSRRGGKSSSIQPVRCLRNNLYKRARPQIVSSDVHRPEARWFSNPPCEMQCLPSETRRARQRGRGSRIEQVSGRGRWKGGTCVPSSSKEPISKLFAASCSLHRILGGPLPPENFEPLWQAGRSPPVKVKLSSAERKMLVARCPIFSDNCRVSRHRRHAGCTILAAQVCHFPPAGAEPKSIISAPISAVTAELV